jgi:hypothetical protein
MRFDNPLGGDGGDRGIHCVAPFAQDIETDLRRDWVRGADHALIADGHGSSRVLEVAHQNRSPFKCCFRRSLGAGGSAPETAPMFDVLGQLAWRSCQARMGEYCLFLPQAG